MPPLHHRVPGLAGAVLAHDGVAAEIVCDGVHVHPSMVRLALCAKGPERVMAITDGTAGSGLPEGAASTIGGRPIVVRNAAYLEDGTLAGSAITMQGAFRFLVEVVGVPLHDAAMACSTTPARQLGLHGLGVVTTGATADLAVLDPGLRVTQTYVDGRLVFDSEERA
jgi:N-acetylglucosamine-6-phosphate deacetylase